jgi:nucleotidyltransferase substrate binding protein (TIGR01987 family)
VSEPRWIHRLRNFERALARLGEAVALEDEGMSDLAREGMIQRFEFTFELAWKTLSDYLSFAGVNVEQQTPRNVLKQAFAAGVIPDGQVWIDMLEHRNLMSHIYSETEFRTAVVAVRDVYAKALRSAADSLGEQAGRL